MPNTLSYLVLFSWPLVVFILFSQLPRAQALCLSVLIGYLLLPVRVGINLPVLPTLDKDLIPALTSGLCCLITADVGSNIRRRRQAALQPPSDAASGAARPASATSRRMAARRRGARTTGDAQAPGTAAVRRAPVPRAILAMGVLLFVNVFLTLLTNLDPYRIGNRSIQGLQLYDAFASLQREAILLLPYVLGAIYLARPQQNRILLQVLCGTAVLYSLLTLWEIRMSPQLNRTIYGYLSQPFVQAMRGDGGYRPVVFLQHGLWLAIFNAMAALGAFALWRNERMAGRPAFGILAAGLWMSAVLAMSHSLGALLILIVLAPVVLVFPLRFQLLVAAALAAILLLYPMLRGGGVIPTQAAYGLAASISETRADSLRFRLENEDILMEHANEKPLSGWGGYGRSRVYDPTTGEDISTTDGMWVIVMGLGGWLGYIAKYGLLGLPVILLAMRRRLDEDPFVVAGLALLLIANLVDMIANATLTPVTWLVAGALAGRAALPEDVPAEAPAAAGPRRARARIERRRPGAEGAA